MTDKLKLCPFCGSRWEVKKYFFPGHPEGVWLANCRKCPAEMDRDYKRKINAIKAVNRRVE